MKQQGGTNAAVIDLCFVASHVADIASRIGAVVIEVEHDRIFANSELVEGREKFANVLIDVDDHRGDPSQLVKLGAASFGGKIVHQNRREIDLFVFLVEFLWYIVERAVRGIGGDVTEERFSRFGLLASEINCCVKEDVGAVTFHGHFVTVVKKCRVGVLSFGSNRIRRRHPGESGSRRTLGPSAAWDSCHPGAICQRCRFGSPLR